MSKQKLSDYFRFGEYRGREGNSEIKRSIARQKQKRRQRKYRKNKGNIRSSTASDLTATLITDSEEIEQAIIENRDLILLYEVSFWKRPLVGKIFNAIEILNTFLANNMSKSKKVKKELKTLSDQHMAALKSKDQYATELDTIDPEKDKDRYDDVQRALDKYKELVELAEEKIANYEEKYGKYLNVQDRYLSEKKNIKINKLKLRVASILELDPTAGGFICECHTLKPVKHQELKRYLI